MGAVAAKLKTVEFQAGTFANFQAATPTRPTDESTASSANWTRINLDTASLDESRESIEVTEFGDNIRDRIYGLADVGGSLAGIYSDTSAAYTTLRNAMRNEVPMWFRYTPGGNTAGNVSTVFAGIVTACNQDGEVSSRENFNMTIEGLAVQPVDVTLV